MGDGGWFTKGKSRWAGTGHNKQLAALRFVFGSAVEAASGGRYIVESNAEHYDRTSGLDI
jgi:hypothetical protein